MNPLIHFNEVTHYYRSGFFSHKRALTDFNLAVFEGECVGLLGHNGAGKTTALKILLGFLRSNSGVAHILGQDITLHSKLKRQLAYVPENVRFHPHLTPEELFTFYGKLNGISFTCKKILALMEEVGIPADKLKCRIDTFSKGTNQRLAVALVLMKKAKIIIMDEPTTGLDPTGRLMLKNIVLSLKKTGAALLISSHQLLDMEQMTDKVAVIQDGTMLEIAEVSWLKRRNRQFQVIFEGNCSSLFEGLSLNVTIDKKNTTVVTENLDMANEITNLGVKKGHILEYFGPLPYSLEDYYMAMVGRKS